jgi:hypothetical protein
VSRASTHQHEPYHLAEWLAHVYEHERRPPARQRDVLTALAVHYVDWGTGLGYASIKSLADFCRASRATVQRALRWGREACLIVRITRGTRAGDGTPHPSQWRLVSSLRITTPAVESALYTSGGVC